MNLMNILSGLITNNKNKNTKISKKELSCFARTIMIYKTKIAELSIGLAANQLFVWFGDYILYPYCHLENGHSERRAYHDCCFLSFVLLDLFVLRLVKKRLA